MRCLSLAVVPPLLALAAAPLVAQGPPLPPPQLESAGHAEARVTPDRAYLTVAVETHGATAAQAGAENARRTQAVLDALRGAGVPRELITTSGYGLSPEQVYDQKTGPRITGYGARNGVRVEVRRTDQVGRLIDVALAAGANRVDGLEFWASTLEAARRTALGAAVANACRDAEALARGAGGRLGPLLEASAEEGGAPPVRPMMMAKLANDAATTPVEVGESAVPVTVRTRWTFVPAGGTGAVTTCAADGAGGQ